MHPGEHEVMARVERDHWWYRGLRDACVGVLERPATALPDRPRILDAGCGTGENLRCFSEALRPSYLGGFDLSAQAVELAAAKVPEADLWVGDICDPQLRETGLDLVVSLDVIYIPGAARALPGLRRLVEALRPGGLLLVNLPAYDWLYSEHDVAIHTSERYTARRVRGLFEQLDLSIELLTYRLCLLFPLVVLSRLPGMLRARPGDETAQSDLHRPPGTLANRVMFAALAAENRLIRHGLRWPWGSSVFAMGRKR